MTPTVLLIMSDRQNSLVFPIDLLLTLASAATVCRKTASKFVTLFSATASRSTKAGMMETIVSCCFAASNRCCYTQCRGEKSATIHLYVQKFFREKWRHASNNNRISL